MQRIEVFDNNGLSIGVKDMQDIESKDNVPVVYVVLYNSFGEIFIVELPGEDDRKNLYYQKYSVSASEILNYKELPTNVAKKVLSRDFNILLLPKFLGQSTFSFNDSKRIGYFFALKYDDEFSVNLDSAQKGEFVGREMIDNMILQDPDIYTPSFLEFWNKFSDKLEL